MKIRVVYRNGHLEHECRRQLLKTMMTGLDQLKFGSSLPIMNSAWNISKKGLRMIENVGRQFPDIGEVPTQKFKAIA